VGTQTLLDALVDYAPPPTDYGSEQLCALAFKTEQDARLGRLTYVRVYRRVPHRARRHARLQRHDRVGQEPFQRQSPARGERPQVVPAAQQRDSGASSPTVDK